MCYFHDVHYENSTLLLSTILDWFCMHFLRWLQIESSALTICGIYMEHWCFFSYNRSILYFLMGLSVRWRRQAVGLPLRSTEVKCFIVSVTSSQDQFLGQCHKICKIVSTAEEQRQHVSGTVLSFLCNTQETQYHLDRILYPIFLYLFAMEDVCKMKDFILFWSESDTQVSYPMVYEWQVGSIRKHSQESIHKQQ